MTILIAAYDPAWPGLAMVEAALWAEHIGPVLIACHHIGSTAVPGLAAKPIIDLLPVVTDHDALGTLTDRLETAGYQALGEFGLPGRRYFRRSGADGTRLVHAHAYEQGHPDIRRHLAFRDLLRREATLRQAYEAVKRRCAETSADHHAYGACKSGWIATHETLALSQEAR